MLLLLDVSQPMPATSLPMKLQKNGLELMMETLISLFQDELVRWQRYPMMRS